MSPAGQADWRYLYRRLKNNFMMGLTLVATAVTLLPLCLILGFLISKGLSGLSLNFFIHLPKPVGEPGGGMANAIVGSFELIGLASLIGIPLGVGAGLFLSEYGQRGPLGMATRFAADVLIGMPSIVIGIFAYAMVVRPLRSFSALAGGVALGLIMIPIVCRTTEEMVRLVPRDLREAALALGVTRWRTSVSVVVRTALSGIATGVISAIARVAGETAPLLFTALGNHFWSHSLLQPVASLTVQVYTYAISPFADWQRQAWTGALVLTLIVFGLEVGVRWITRGRLRTW